MKTRSAISGLSVVVAGASSGVGRGVSLALARAGASVVLVGRRREALDEVASAIGRSGGQARVAAVDLTDDHAGERIVDVAVTEFGRVDVWVHCAAGFALGRFWEVPLDDHRHVIEVTAVGALRGAHAALREFTRQGHGTLVFVDSLESRVPIAYHSSYAASKAAVSTLARSIHQELRLSGFSGRIRVGSVQPWALDTPLWEHAANRLGRAPRMAAMEDPDRVVRAVVRACLHPRLSRPVGVKARVVGAASRAFPRTVDRVAAWISGRELARAGTAASTPGSLYEPRSDRHRVQGTTRARMAAEDAPSTTTPTKENT